MRFLRNLYMVTEGNSTDLSRLPSDIMSAIKRNIKKGAEDLNQKWANALELVHRAYEVEGIQRPDPTMEAAWKQYEENLAYAVEQLAKNRGMDGDWRMSSSIFHEALNRQTFKVKVFENNDVKETYITEAKDLNSVLSSITESIDMDPHITSDISTTRISFTKWGIRNPLNINVERIK